MTKILYSPGFGAGWSTWMHGSKEFQKWALTYQPIIDALERGEKLNGDDGENNPVLKQFLQEAKEKFDEEYVCVLGADQLSIYEVSGPFRVDEYDGSESVVEAANEEWISV